MAARIPKRAGALSPILQLWEAGKAPPQREPTEDERTEAVGAVYSLAPVKVRSWFDHPHRGDWLEWIKPR
jgi:hypothetical protein